MDIPQDFKVLNLNFYFKNKVLTLKIKFRLNILNPSYLYLFNFLIELVLIFLYSGLHSDQLFFFKKY